MTSLFPLVHVKPRACPVDGLIGVFVTPSGLHKLDRQSRTDTDKTMRYGKPGPSRCGMYIHALLLPPLHIGKWFRTAQLSDYLPISQHSMTHVWTIKSPYTLCTCIAQYLLTALTLSSHTHPFHNDLQFQLVDLTACDRARCCRASRDANAYVWNNICGVYVSDESILVGSRCDINFPCDAPQYEGFYAVCCSSYLNCSGDTDGAAGLNCTLVGTEVEPE